MFLDFFQRHRAGILLVFFASLSFLSMALRLSGPINAFKSSLWFLVSPGIVRSGQFFNTLDLSTGRFFNLVRAEAENTLLREQNAQLAKRDVERDALEAENNRLRALLGLKQQYFPKGISADVVGLDMRDWFRTIILNKGASSGINTSAAVVAVSSDRPVLVGRVADVSDETSKILLLTDALSATAVSIVRTGDLGLLEGQTKPWTKLGYLPHLSDVAVGDEVVTAGLGGIFPPHIYVGVVVSVNDSPNGFFKEALVQPANLGSLRNVLVLERKELRGTRK
ncbi:MAG: hypothetical protein KCHDKBKB_00941 [Elusimicrobia bacterium]|nr:hypothetical protein [Elusimicrobiota bacterium]